MSSNTSNASSRAIGSNSSSISICSRSNNSSRSSILVVAAVKVIVAGKGQKSFVVSRNGFYGP